MPIDPTAPVPFEKYLKLKKAFLKYREETDQTIQDLWDRINAIDNNVVEKTDEAIDIANRARRAVSRLQKELE